MSKSKKWPHLGYLIARSQKHAWEQHCELQLQQEVIEEKRRAADGVRIQSLAEFQEGIAKGQILARIPGILYEWSHWITGGDDGAPSREFAVSLYDAHDGAFSTLLDARGKPVALFEADTMRLDHFVSWDEFIDCYPSWSVSGIPTRDEEGPREE